jgi:ATP-binding cassette subfamily B protein
MINSTPSNNLLRKLKTALHIKRAMNLVWRNAPGWTAANIALVLAQGVTPLLTLLVMKQIVDAVAFAAAGAGDPSFRPALFWILMAFGLAVLTLVLRLLSEWVSEGQSATVSDAVADLIHRKSTEVDLGYYEDPAFFNTLQRTQQEAPTRPVQIVGGLVESARSIISLSGIAVLLFAFDWWVGVILILASLPAAWVRLVYSRKLYRFESDQVERERGAWYYHWIMTDGAHAKEVRLFDMGSHFMELFKTLRGELRKGRLSLAGRRALSELATQSVAILALFTAFGLIALETAAGTITLGAMVMYFQGFQRGLQFLQGLLKGMTGLYESNLFLTHFYRFLELEPTVKPPAKPQALQDGPVALEVRGLDFAYPRIDKPVLQQIDMDLAPGQVVGLVGKNGSGKSTLVKLLSRFYDPISGSVAANGIDLRKLDPRQWRKRVAVMFQDFVQYNLSAGDNIALGQTDVPLHKERMAGAAALAGAESLVQTLPQDYDTLLGYWFNEGRQLSRGEWQKLALARTFYKQADVLILDEPTASLDPLAEAGLFSRFRQWLGQRSALVISHRFAAIHLADYIYVLDSGRIVEQGTHHQLMELNGFYSELFRRQTQGKQAP